MPFDQLKAATWIRGHALPPFGRGQCAAHVRQALEAGGLSTAGHPVDAKDWGPTLLRIGFRAVSPTSYSPLRGDVVVMQGTSKSKSGHIEFFDGTNWISDFIQRELWPGPSFRTEKPTYCAYRFNG